MFDEIKKIAQKSQMKYRLSAVVYDGDGVMSMGFNRPIVTKELAGRGYRSIHAEIDALRRLDVPRDSSKLTMIVVRVRRDCSFGNAKPCARCLSAIRRAGIKKVIYTDSSGNSATINI